MLHRRRLFSLGLAVVCLFTMMSFVVYPAGTVNTSAATGDYFISISAPDAGDAFAPGSTHTISWSHSGADGLGAKVNISLYKGGSLRSIIKSGVATGAGGEGSYSWTLPAGIPDGNDYQVKVLAASRPAVFDMSGYFTVEAGSSGQEDAQDEPFFNMVSPAGGTVWALGSQQTVRWNYTGNPGSYATVTLFKAGKSVVHMASRTSVGSNGSGAYTWTVPATLAEGSDYQVKVLGPLCPEGSWSGYFTIGAGGPSQQQDEQTDATGQVLINDPSFVTLTAVPNPEGGSDSLFKLQVKANNSSSPVEVSYLVLNPAATPDHPSTGMQVSQLSESENAWGSSQNHSHTEVGGWAMPQYQKNPQSFALPHYRTCVMMLARYEKIYTVFIRENDGQLSYRVFQGGAFNGLEVPGLAQVVRSGDQFQIHSLGSAVEVGIWDKGTYKHDEVTGWAQASYQANDKLYPVPKYGMFMLAFGRYGNMGLIIGNMNDGRLGTVCFAGSKLLGTENVPGLCEISNAGSPHVRIRATGSAPVEVSQFAFDNTCWQWEVNGWGQPGFQGNPQIFPMKHYTPGFFTCSRYDKTGVFFYNENDAQLGILPLNAATQVSGSQAVILQSQQNQASSENAIKVYVNGRLLSFDQPPVIIDGSTMVPMRAIFESLGAQVAWDGPNQMVIATKGNITIKLILGMRTALVNGHETALSQPAQLMGGRTMVPLRFVSEALGALVNWDGATRTITITLDGTVTPPDTIDQSQASDGKRVIEEFFRQVDAGNINAAMGMLDAGALGDAGMQEMWRNSLGAIDSAAIKTMEESNRQDWPQDFEQYKVVVSITIKAGSPPTLWSNGEETRWISVEEINGQWKILELATGP